ncbi:hypothetical protein T484DRAFT_1772514 [Baffinella frigidus]|nr:hypothetical protein T484DRAFT_1772514 [Cryptophyta sp. CCMP2293]
MASPRRKPTWILPVVLVLSLAAPCITASRAFFGSGSPQDKLLSTEDHPGYHVPTGFEQAHQWARAAHGEDVSDAELDAIDADDDLALPQLGRRRYHTHDALCLPTATAFG